MKYKINTGEKIPERLSLFLRANTSEKERKSIAEEHSFTDSYANQIVRKRMNLSKNAVPMFRAILELGIQNAKKTKKEAETHEKELMKYKNESL